jgi:hypothetical protein
MFWGHHQEVASVCVANGICFSSQWSVSGPGCKGVYFHPGPPTDHLEEKLIVYQRRYNISYTLVYYCYNTQWDRPH